MTYHDLAPLTPALTLQEKFEQGWGINHRNGNKVTEIVIMKSGKIVTTWENFIHVAVYYTESEFLLFHTITPPAPKRYSMFTFVYNADDRMCDIRTGNDFQTLEEAKANMPEDTTCILEHEKQGDKWVFVKAHEI